MYQYMCYFCFSNIWDVNDCRLSWRIYGYFFYFKTNISINLYPFTRQDFKIYQNIYTQIRKNKKDWYDNWCFLFNIFQIPIFQDTLFQSILSFSSLICVSFYIFFICILFSLRYFSYGFSFFFFLFFIKMELSIFFLVCVFLKQMVVTIAFSKWSVFPNWLFISR